jgi:DNA-binding HxlR family transcriptional regulator
LASTENLQTFNTTSNLAEMVNRGLIQRIKEDKKPKVIENPKSSLVVTGRRLSQTVREVLTAFVSE